MNFFSFYGFEVQFDINENELKKAYYEKMRSLHPDMHMQASESEKELLLQQSSYNNKAYNTLKDFNARLQYILQEFGPKTDEKPLLPPNFLMEMMEVNEEVMELQFDFSLEKADSIKKAIEAQQEEQLKSLESVLKDKSIETSLDVELSSAIQDYLMKRNYLIRIIENIEKLT